MEDVGENTCDQYETASENTDDSESQSLIMDEENTTDSDHDASEPRHPPVAKMTPSEYKEKNETSLWTFAVDGIDTDGPSFDTDDDDAFSELPAGEAEAMIQGDNIKIQQHIQHRLTTALSDVAPANRPSHASAVVSRTGQPRVSPLKQLTLDDFLIKHSEGSQPSPPSHHNAAFSHISSKMKTAKRGRQEQAEESMGEAATLDDDDDFFPSRVTSKNAPIAKANPIKKRRH